MQIACPGCATSYEVAEAALGAAGRSVRCVRCRKVWFAANEGSRARTASGAPLAFAAAAGAPAAQVAAAAQGDRAGAAAMQAERDAAVPPPPPAALADAPPLAPTEAGLLDPDRQEPREIDPIAGTRASRPKWRRPGGSARGPGWPTLILSLLAVIGAILAWRAEIVRLLPQTASLFAALGLPVNLRGLAFTEVKTIMETHEGVPVLVVEGAISNLTRSRREAPRLRFALRDRAGVEVHAWTAQPERQAIGGGEKQPFRTRLASPPAEGREVLVRFVTRRDIENGLR